MDTYPYTPLFCEENIWQLAQQMVAEGADPATLQVILIANAQQQVVLFGQRNGGDLGYIVWDYHVLLRQKEGETDRIFDLDTLLPCPCDSRDYMEATFGLQQELPAPYRAQLRLIPAASYLARLYSDRSHMRGVVPEAQFPPWPAPLPAGGGAIPLSHYRQPGRELDDGSRVVDVAGFMATELSPPCGDRNDTTDREG